MSTTHLQHDPPNQDPGGPVNSGPPDRILRLSAPTVPTDPAATPYYLNKVSPTLPKVFHNVPQSSYPRPSTTWQLFALTLRHLRGWYCGERGEGINYG